MRLLITLLAMLLLWQCSPVEAERRGQLLINEVMAKNSQTSGIIAPNGNYEDWIELYNSGEDTLLLSDFFITDTRDDLVKANLPTEYLAPNEHLILWCGGKGNMGSHFLGFAISTQDTFVESVYLVDKNLTIVDSCILSNSSEALKKSRSYGRLPDGGSSWSVQAYPSPDRANNG